MTLQSSNITTKINKRLSVQFSLSGLSFLVEVSNSNEILFFSETIFKQKQTPEDLLAKLQTEFLANVNLQGSFQEVNIIYATSLYSVVPTSLFDKNIASEYLKFNSKILSNDFIAYDTLDDNKITVVYIPFVNINNYLFDRFGDFNYYHSTSLLVKYLLKKEKKYSLPKVFINVENGTFDFIAIKNGELSLCNSYEYKTPEDFIYYILFCLEQLKFNPETIDLVVFGAIEKKDKNYSILYKYIRNISFIQLEEAENKILSEENLEHQNLLLKLI